MPDLILSEREQHLVRSLLAIDPVPGDPVAVAPVLELVSQLCLDRRSRPFSARDLDLLRMIAPALQRAAA